jgi:hypothetical protein
VTCGVAESAVQRATIRAYEALVRGPQSSPLESPAALFGQAAAAGLLPELDRAAAIEGALAAGLRPPHTLFLN